ncbi:hypothetical protein NC652_029056 [Populus alba x Populus x berolinensis]|nr:hypothetical protein NC652_029056 [Populus alba x Populus x berolinensis]
MELFIDRTVSEITTKFAPIAAWSPICSTDELRQESFPEVFSSSRCDSIPYVNPNKELISTSPIITWTR